MQRATERGTKKKKGKIGEKGKKRKIESKGTQEGLWSRAGAGEMF